MASERDDLLRDEERRIRRLRRAVDLALAALRTASISRAEAEEIAAHTRQVALRLFPDKAEVFDLVIAPRLERAIDERFPTTSPSDAQGPVGNA